MQITSWRSLFLAGTVSLLIIYIFWWGRMIGDPVERSSADFIHFYSAGRIAQSHGFAYIYNAEYQQKVEQEVVGFPLAEGQVLLYNHMPYLVPLLALVMSGNYVASFVRWALVLISVYFIGTQFLIKSVFASEKEDVHLAWFAGTLTFLPLFISLWQGQDTAFLYLGIVFWYIGILKKQDWLIGVGLAIATLRPHIAIALTIPLFFRNQRAWWYSIISISMLAFVSVILIKAQGIFGFVNLLRITSEGTWFGMMPATMLNLLGFILRIVQLPNSGIASLVGWLIYLAGIVTICGLWKRSKIIDGRLMGLSILIGIVTAPVLHFHDLTLLVFPLLYIAHNRMVSHSEPRWVLLPLGASLFLLIGVVLEGFFFILPYILFIMLAWLLLLREPSLLAIENANTE